MAADLVETVVRQLRPTFRLEKLEGDAAFMVAPILAHIADALPGDLAAGTGTTLWIGFGLAIGGAIFDVRVVPCGDKAMSLRDASMRWIALYLSLATGGLALALAALPSRQSLPDRMSHTRCVRA